MPSPKKKPANTEKPECDPKTCGSCESYTTVHPSDEAGYCFLLPPAWVEIDGESVCTEPVVTPDRKACRFYLRKLQS